MLAALQRKDKLGRIIGANFDFEIMLAYNAKYRVCGGSSVFRIFDYVINKNLARGLGEARERRRRRRQRVSSGLSRAARLDRHSPNLIAPTRLPSPTVRVHRGT